MMGQKGIESCIHREPVVLEAGNATIRDITPEWTAERETD